MPRRALCITGMPGCGKEEVLKVAVEGGYAVVRMGDVVRAEAARRGLPATDAGVGGMAHEERERHGPAVWARRTLAEATADDLVIDGIRSLHEVAYFREAFGEALTVVAVHASPRTRHRRIARRQRRDDAETEEALRRRDERELAWGLGQVIALADRMIVNEGSLEDLRKGAGRLLQEVFG